MRATAPLKCKCVRRQDPMSICHQVLATHHPHVVELDSEGIIGKVRNGDQAQIATLPPGRSTGSDLDKDTTPHLPAAEIMLRREVERATGPGFRRCGYLEVVPGVHPAS